MASLARVMPAPIEESKIQKINQIALDAFRVLNGNGVVRIDMIIKGDNVYLNEVNNIPGSLSFYLWEQTGLTYPQLLDALIDLGVNNYFEKQKSGHLVAISSIGGLRGSRQAPAYNATKAYQINYLEGLRQKAKKLNTSIFVTDIRPGLVDTEMAKGEGLFWVMPVEKAARQIFQAIIDKKKVAYVTRRWGLIATILKQIPRPIHDRM